MRKTSVRIFQAVTLLKVSRSGRRFHVRFTWKVDPSPTSLTLPFNQSKIIRFVLDDKNETDGRWDLFWHYHSISRVVSCIDKRDQVLQTASTENPYRLRRLRLRRWRWRCLRPFTTLPEHHLTDQLNTSILDGISKCVRIKLKFSYATAAFKCFAHKIPTHVTFLTVLPLTENLHSILPIHLKTTFPRHYIRFVHQLSHLPLT